MRKLAFKCLTFPVLSLGYALAVVEVSFRAGRRIAVRHIHKLYQG